MKTRRLQIYCGWRQGGDQSYPPSDLLTISSNGYVTWNMPSNHQYLRQCWFQLDDCSLTRGRDQRDQPIVFTSCLAAW